MYCSDDVPSLAPPLTQVSEDFIGSAVLTYPTRDGAQFASNLHQVLDDLHCLLSGKDFKQ